MKVCHKCASELPFESRVGRSHECPTCLAPARCCKNCQFYEPSAHNQCREIGTEPVRDREAANYCDAFTFFAGPRAGPRDDADSAKKKLDSLFNL